MTNSYPVVVERRNGRYYLLISELNLIAESEDLQSGFEDIEDQKETLIGQYTELGRSHEIPAARNQNEQQELRRSMTPFLIKAAVVAVIGAIFIGVANLTVIYSLQTAPGKLASRAARVAVKNFGAAFEKVANEEMTPEKVAKIRLLIKNAVPALMPFAEELRPLFACPPAEKIG